VIGTVFVKSCGSKRRESMTRITVEGLYGG
jgi:hypothetical protein